MGLSGSRACSPFLDQRKLPFALPNMALRETLVPPGLGYKVWFRYNWVNLGLIVRETQNYQ